MPGSLWAELQLFGLNIPLFSAQKWRQQPGWSVDGFTKRILPITRDRMSRTAGSGDPKESARLFNKGAAIFLVGGNVSPGWISRFYWLRTGVRLRSVSARSAATRGAFLTRTAPDQGRGLTSSQGNTADFPLPLPSSCFPVNPRVYGGGGGVFNEGS